MDATAPNMSKKRKARPLYYLVLGVCIGLFLGVAVSNALLRSNFNLKQSRWNEYRYYSTELITTFLEKYCEEGEWPEPGAINFSPYYNFNRTETDPDGNRIDVYYASNGERWDLKLSKDGKLKVIYKSMIPASNQGADSILKRNAGDR
jgi:hypothetical protein